MHLETETSRNRERKKKASGIVKLHVSALLSSLDVFLSFPAATTIVMPLCLPRQPVPYTKTLTCADRLTISCHTALHRCALHSCFKATATMFHELRSRPCLRKSYHEGFQTSWRLHNTSPALSVLQPLHTSAAYSQLSHFSCQNNFCIR